MNQEHEQPAEAPNIPPEHRERIAALFQELGEELENYLQARLKGSREEARELAQEVFKHLLQRPEHEVADWRALSWWYARNLSSNRIRHLKMLQTKTTVLDDAVAVPDHRTPESTWGEAEERAAILCAVKHLPDKRQRIVLTRALEGASLATIAREIGVSERHCRRIHWQGVAAVQLITGLGPRT
jgi:RNA polymerase sigma factor (sigma-70 family)